MKKRAMILWLVAVLSVLAGTPGIEAQGDPVSVEEQQSEPIATAEPAATEDEPAAVVVEPQTAPAAQSGVPTSVVGGVTSAARDTAATVKEGGAGVAQQGRMVWTDVLVPVWKRLAAGLPAVVKALVMLLAFWVIALVVSGLVRRVLSMTRADERAVTDWGLGSMLRTEDGETRSIERLASVAVKWLILLVGFVAFFQTLDVSMVAAPLERVVDRILAVVPSLLQAAVILAVYWILATILRAGVGTGLEAIGFDRKASRFLPEREIAGQVVQPSGLVARLVFYVVLILGIAPLLDALGQRSLVEPLSVMLSEVLSFLPNLVGAALILFLGHLIGVVVREVVTNLLAAAGADAGAQKIGLGGAAEKLKLSGIVGSVAYFFIIVPVVGASVEALGLRAISEPVSRTLTTLLAAVPLVFVAVVIGGLGYFLARIVRGIVQSFLHGVGFDALPAKMGLEALKRDDSRFAPSSVVATAVMLLIVLLTAEQALATLQLEELSESIGRLIGFLPEVVIALALILAAWIVAGFAAPLVESAVAGAGPARLLSSVTRYSILGFGIALALGELGIGGGLISVLVAAILGGAALALGLAFGLGGKERARQWIESSSE